MFQYGFDLLDLERWRAPGEVDLWGEAHLATQANERSCRELGGMFATYRRFWGLSAGDGPGPASDTETYRAYAPSGPLDGTAHVMATVASIGHCPASVLENIHEASHDRQLDALGRYGALTAAPIDAKVLGPLILKEIHYRLLMAPFGGIVWGKGPRRRSKGAPA